MAITIGSITTNNSTVNDNAPSVAVPSGASAGDLYVLFWCNLLSGTVTWPAGFTDIGVVANETNVLGYMRAAVRTATGSESGSFTGSTANYQKWEARCVVVHGAQATPDVVSANSTYQYGSSSNLDGASITTTGAGRTILWAASAGSGSGAACTATVTPPSGLSTDSFTDRGNGATVAIAHGTQASAGAATYSGSASFGGVADSRGADILVLAFTQAGGNAFTGGMSESITLTDTGTGVSAFQAVASESGTFSDMSAASSASAHALTESGTLTDTQAVSQGTISAVAEAASVADMVAGAWGSASAAGESLMLSDAFSPNAMAVGAMMEAVNAADSASASSSFVATVFELAGLIDLAEAAAAFVAQGTESIALLDALGVQFTASASMSEVIGLIDGVAVLSGLTAEIVESGALTDAMSAFLGSISIGADSPAFWVVPLRRNFIKLPPRLMFTKYSVKPLTKRSSETITVDVDASAYLGEGVAISVVLSASVEPVTDTPLDVSGLQFNTHAIVINGNTVGAGNALQMIISGGQAGPNRGARGYLVRVLCNTDRGNDVAEVLVPVQVDDYPYIT